MNRSPLLRLAGAVLLCAAAPLFAQRPSLWTTVTMPAGSSQPNAIGTTVSFTSPGAVHLYSGVTKRWTVVPVGPGATVFQANDYFIVRDGTTLHGLATHIGTLETITVGAAATVVSGSASSSWTTIVADGAQAWSFGAFHGKWESQVLSQPNPTMAVSRLCGLLRDGTTVYGVSAYHGTFVPVAADAAATLSLVGEAEVGTANSPGVLRAFSVQQNTWGVQSVPGATGSYQRNEFAMMWAGNQIWAFSGLSGALASYTATAPITAVDGAEGVAAFVDGSDVVCYGAGRGQFVARASNNPTLTFDYHLAFLDEGTQVTPFSAITNTFGPTLVGAFGLGSNDDVGYAANATQVYGYSPIKNLWSLAPMSAPLSVSVVRSAVVLGDTTGYCAMSARTATWVAQATTTVGVYQAPANSATFVALDGLGEIAHVYDARLGRWATVSGPSPWTVDISRHTVVVYDGQTAHGFGQPSGEWYPLTFLSTPTTLDVASSIAAVVHGTDQLSVYCVQGSFSYTGRYPEFTQAVNLGQTIHMHQVAAPGSLLFTLVGLAPGYLDVRPAVDGVAYVDPTLAVAAVWPQLVDADGYLDMDFTVPNHPAFVGLQLHFQNLVVEPAGQPWLSTSVAPIVF